MHTLGPDQDATTLVRAHFDEERAAVVAAVREALAANGEPADPARVEELVDRELTEALRFPDQPGAGLLAALYVRRGALAAGLASLAAIVLVVLLLL